MTCLLLLDGELGDAAAVKRAARAARAVICADGGLRHARRLRLRVDVVVGDMDSLPRPLRGDATYWCDFDPNRSDFEKALDFARGSGFSSIVVAGARGGRLDHELVNLALIEKYSGVIPILALDGRGGTARVLGPGRYSGFARPGGLFSVVAAAKAVVTLGGSKYPLSKFPLAAGSRGLSNVAKARAVLTVHSGRVWLVA